MLTIGVLALQGDFAKHIKMLRSLNVTAIEVRCPKDLEGCDGLIIPGGESTTIRKLMQYIGFENPLKDFAKLKPVFGTCAGLILISHEIISNPVQPQPMNLIEVSVERNAFGSQIDSFSEEVQLHLGSGSSGTSKAKAFTAVFIRAPRIRSVSAAVQVLAFFKGEPILVKQGHHLGATFHPELTDDSTIHAYFLSLAKARQSQTK